MPLTAHCGCMGSHYWPREGESVCQCSAHRKWSMPDSTHELIDGATTGTAVGFPAIYPRLFAKFRADASSDASPVERAVPQPVSDVETLGHQVRDADRVMRSLIAPQWMPRLFCGRNAEVGRCDVQIPLQSDDRVVPSTLRVFDYPL